MDCLARGLGPLIITKLTVGPPLRARLCEILYCIVRLDMTVTKRHLAWLLYSLLRKRDVSHAIRYTD